MPFTSAPIYVILDTLSANTAPAIKKWATARKVTLCLTPTNASRANPITPLPAAREACTVTEYMLNPLEQSHGHR